MRRWSRPVLRLAVAGGLTAYILWRSHPADVLAVAASADWRMIALAVGLVLADRALMACRWVVLLCIVDPADRPPLPAVMRVFFVSTFVGTFLPASIGGDAVRAYSMTKLKVRGGDAVASVFMDRMLGVASILLIALGGLALATDLARNWTINIALAGAAAVCAATLLLVFSARAAVAATRLMAWLPQRAETAGGLVVIAVRRYASHHGRLLAVLGSSVAVQILRIVQAYYLGRSLGIAAPLGAYFAVIPLILLVMLLPVTFNGIGTSQVAFVWFFAPMGVPAAQAFALSLLFVALGVVGNLPGGLLYAFARRTPRAEAVGG